MNKKNVIIAGFLLSILIIISKFPFPYITVSAATTKDVTSQALLLGNPFKKGAYANNIWDMQVYNNRIYFGHGDFNNNAGPIPVIYYNPANNEFINQYTVDEEQIDVYKIINDKLYIPGYDARESWNLGNFYVLEKDQWMKYRTIPQAIHVNDLACYNGRLYAAVTTSKTGWGEVLASDNMGKTWSSQVPPNENFMLVNDWAASFLEFDDKLCAAGALIFPLSPGAASWYTKFQNLLVIDSTGPKIHSYDQSFLPKARKDCQYTIKRQTKIADSILYLSGFFRPDDIWSPESLYAAKDINDIRRIILPNANTVPSDILSRNNTAYVLTFIENLNRSFTNIVYKSDDLENWTELFRLDTDTFARSFEELNGDFYLGLGCTKKSLSTSAGNIIKVPSSTYQNQIDTNEKPGFFSKHYLNKLFFIFRSFL